MKTKPKAKPPTPTGGLRRYGHDPEAATPRIGMAALDVEGGTFGFIVKIDGVHAYLDCNSGGGGKLHKSCLTDLQTPARGSAGDVAVRGSEDDPAEAWQRGVFAAFDRAHGGIVNGTIEETRERVLAWLGKDGKPYAVPADPSHIAMGGTVSSMAIPLDAVVAGVPVSPFYIGDKLLWQIVNQMEVAVEAMKKASPTNAERIAGLWKIVVGGTQDACTELCNLDSHWEGGAV